MNYPTPMTGDELAARLYAEQGYLVIESPPWRPHAIGDLILIAESPASNGDRFVRIPLVVVAHSNIEEYKKQDDLATSLVGEESSGEFYPNATYYRVEAAD
jgi:hypothetical protein